MAGMDEVLLSVCFMNWHGFIQQLTKNTEQQLTKNTEQQLTKNIEQ